MSLPASSVHRPRGYASATRPSQAALPANRGHTSFRPLWEHALPVHNASQPGQLVRSLGLDRSGEGVVVKDDRAVGVQTFRRERVGDPTIRHFARGLGLGNRGVSTQSRI